MELFGLMTQIDNGKSLLSNNDSMQLGNKKIAWKDWYSLTVINYKKYKTYENDEAMNFYRGLSKAGISDVFIIGFLLQVDEVPFAKINSTTDKELIYGFSKKNDTNEAVNTANTFLQSMNNFYNKINFKNYLQENNENYLTIINDVKKNLPKRNLIPVMENFYQKQFRNYYFIPSLNQFPTTGFGQLQKSTNTIYDVFGAFGLQSFSTSPPQLAFDNQEKMLGLAIHEFGHSFVDPAVDSVPQEIIKQTAYLYEPIKEAMSNKGYITWNICLHEHFVKAGEIIIAEQLGETERAKEIMDENVKEHFCYLPQITKQLKIYNNHKDKYKSYNNYIITVIQHLKPVKIN